MEGYTNVMGVSWKTDGIYELSVERNGLDFVPGDCVALFGPDGSDTLSADGAESRPYSISSGTDEPTLRFLIRQMEGGQVSPYLGSLKPGDAVKISPPFGWFRPGQSDPDAPSVFVATGTGIAPFLSYFRSMPDHPPITCLYGVRHGGDALETGWLAGQCDLRLAVSREAVDGAHHGRVTDLLGALPLSPGAHYYLCGLDAMIDQTTVWLEEQGIDITHIHRECFFNAEP